MRLSIEQVAKICHESLKSYCEVFGDKSQTSWEEAAPWQKDSCIQGVKYILNYNKAAGELSGQRSHDAWLQQKLRDGWKYGAVKNVDKKEHPCMLLYYDLPQQQRLKDELFIDIVLCLMKFIS